MKAQIVKKMGELKEMFDENIVDIFPSFIKSRKVKSQMNALVRIPKDNWPEITIVKKLQQLPPEFTVKVDPESLL